MVRFALRLPTSVSSCIGNEALGITRPDETEVDVEARSIWHQSLSSSWTPEKERPAVGRTLLGVESTSFGLVGRLLVVPTSLLTMLVKLSANLSAMMSRLQNSRAKLSMEFPVHAQVGTLSKVIYVLPIVANR